MSRITQTGLSLGTPRYMSPEQPTGDHAIDARTDIYALGALTYEMLTGEPPHTGTTAPAMIARVLTEVARLAMNTLQSNWHAADSDLAELGELAELRKTMSTGEPRRK